jgi:hypothetical protein
MKGDYVDFTEFTEELVAGSFEKCRTYAEQLTDVVDKIIREEENFS